MRQKKIVYQFDQDGNFIQEFESVKEAAEKLGYPDGTISSYTSKERLLYGKFYFSYNRDFKIISEDHLYKPESDQMFIGVF